MQNDIQESIKVKGKLHIELRDKDGNLKETRDVDNLVTTVGLNHIADQLSSSPGNGAMSHMAVGTGVTAPAVGNTALVTELDRNPLTSRTDSGAVLTQVGTWNAGDATGAITEAGIFNAASAGVMLCRATFGVINKAATDSLVITWTHTFA